MRLSREHIIPKKLGGKLVLHNASCDDCGAIINKEVETPTLTKMWVAPRTHLGMPTSSPKINLPLGKWTSDTSGLPANIDDVDFEFEDTPIGNHPFRIMFPRFAPPGILWNEKPSTNFTLRGISMHVSPSERTQEDSNRRAAEFQPFDPSLVCRSIAKIAHGAAVAHFGLESFTPMLPNIILGNDRNISYLVGSTLRKGKKQNSLHQITLDVRRGYVLATVQLFAKYGIQPFLAVVGTAGSELLKWRMSALLTR
jgi:hypothetical protein